MSKFFLKNFEVVAERGFSQEGSNEATTRRLNLVGNLNFAFLAARLAGVRDRRLACDSRNRGSLQLRNLRASDFVEYLRYGYDFDCDFRFGLI